MWCALKEAPIRIFWARFHTRTHINNNKIPQWQKKTQSQNAVGHVRIHFCCCVRLSLWYLTSPSSICECVMQATGTANHSQRKPGKRLPPLSTVGVLFRSCLLPVLTGFLLVLTAYAPHLYHCDFVRIRSEKFFFFLQCEFDTLIQNLLNSCGYTSTHRISSIRTAAYPYHV